MQALFINHIVPECKVYVYINSMYDLFISLTHDNYISYLSLQIK